MQGNSDAGNVDDPGDIVIEEEKHEDQPNKFKTPMQLHKRARKTEDTPAKEAVKCMKSLANIVGARDENSIFGDFVGNKLKNCNRPKAEICLAQHKISDILFRLDMGMLFAEIPSSSRTSSTIISPQSPSSDGSVYSHCASPIEPFTSFAPSSQSHLPPVQQSQSGVPTNGTSLDFINYSLNIDQE